MVSAPVKPEQPLKAPLVISVRLEGSIRDPVKPEHPQNYSLPRA